MESITVFKSKSYGAEIKTVYGEDSADDSTWKPQPDISAVGMTVETTPHMADSKSIYSYRVIVYMIRSIW